MHIGLITLFPQMFEALSCGGITARALKANLIQLSFWNPRDYTQDKHQCVDDRPYGGGPGMIMQVQPLRTALQIAKKNMGETTRVLYLSPQGRCLNQKNLQILLDYKKFILISGRYEGIDERLIEKDVDEEWSIGDYVLSGGELAAMVIIDAIIRWIPGALGHENSANEDSFVNGLLDYPHYTRPEEIDGQKIPPILLSGHHQKIARWRQKQTLGRTWLKRPELIKSLNLTIEEKKLLNEFISEQTQGGNT